jgi:hypothetical protein
MSTSDRMLVLEAAAAAVVVDGAVAALNPGDVWLTGLGFHPAWLPVIVLAARYGPRGLFVSLAITWGALFAVAAPLGSSVDGIVLRIHGTSDLFALIAATLVAWIGMMHESRMTRALGRFAEASGLQHQAEETVDALHDGLAYLRTRHDRLDVSLSLWRNLATRIERGEPADAADAVLELCELRTGATAGLVQLRDGNRLSTVGYRGQWASASARPRDIAGDATVRAAILAREVTPAAPDATEADSDVTAPVLDEGSGVVLGVIALRGVAPGSLRAADLRDLAVLAQWLAPGLARSLSLRKMTGEHRRLIVEGKPS